MISEMVTAEVTDISDKKGGDRRAGGVGHPAHPLGWG